MLAEPSQTIMVLDWTWLVNNNNVQITSSSVLLYLLLLGSFKPILGKTFFFCFALGFSVPHSILLLIAVVVHYADSLRYLFFSGSGLFIFCPKSGGIIKIMYEIFAALANHFS